MGRQMQTHNGMEFKCNRCDKVYSRSDHLKRHEKIHEGQQYLHCGLCDKSFQNKDSLRKHVKLLHQQLRFFCSVWPKAFTHKEQMMAHQMKCKQ